jgi:hypothetical protein
VQAPGKGERAWDIVGEVGRYLYRDVAILAARRLPGGPEQLRRFSEIFEGGAVDEVLGV